MSDWGGLVIVYSKNAFTIAEEVLSIAKNVADQAEVFCVEASSTPVYFEANAIKGKMGPMASVKGVIHCGLLLTVVLYCSHCLI